MSWDFQAQLRRFGPLGHHAPLSRATAQMYCSWLARSHYENFSVATLLLPRPLHRHFHNVYAYCRWADDLADEAGGGQRALDLLAWWRQELHACYQGKPSHPVFVALQQTITQFHIPSTPFLELLLAFEQDQRVKSYETFTALLNYCRHSANPVGRLVLYLCEVHDEERGVFSDHVCTALQLANFWQDVARDLDVGRVYLPREDRLRFGYDDAALSARLPTSAFIELMRFEVERTRELFYKGYPLVEKMPQNMRSDVELFIEGGLAILAKIEQQGFDVWQRRPLLANWEKGLLVAGAVWRRVQGNFRGNGARKQPGA